MNDAAEEVVPDFGVWGTLGNMAPEVVGEDSSGELSAKPRLEHHAQDHQAADLWAAACTAYAILFGEELFLYGSGLSDDEQRAYLQRQQAELVSPIACSVASACSPPCTQHLCRAKSDVALEWQACSIYQSP